uniref:Exocyst subunit Exo70 family protein n=1 Tax=Araucaria cunninghamii TaxID=56994 RepID=A0A0D6QWN5_ARACU
MAAVEGDERVIATAQHIVRSLGSTENMTKDMLRILSNFDNRFSSMSEHGLGLPNDGHEESEIEERLAFAEEMVLRWDMASSEAARQSMIWEGPPEEAASYLQAVDEVQRLTESLVSLSLTETEKKDGNGILDRAQNVLQIAMARLEEEFRNILVQQSEMFEPERIYERSHGHAPVSRVSFCSSSHEEDLVDDEGEGEDASVFSFGSEDRPRHRHVEGSEGLIIDLIRPEVIPDLKDIAERMVASKYEKECCQVYSSVRRDVLDEGLYRLGLEKLSIEEIQKMEWHKLEGKIKKWIQGVNIVVRVLLASEKDLCQQIFGELGSVDTCFLESAKGVVMLILNFSEAVAISRRSPERLFRILDMYECLSDLVQDIYSIFSDEYIRSEAFGILKRLGEAAKGTFVEFENAIKKEKETSKTSIPGGAIHPLTRYVMNYMRFLLEYTGTLKRLMEEEKGGDIQRQLSPTDEFLNSSESEYDCEGSTSNMKSPFAHRLLSITSLLEANLDGKSKLYKDPALSHLFLMNNIHYIVQKVKGSELRTLLGDDWIRKHSGQVRQHATNYQRAAWNKVLSCLRDEGICITGSFSNRVSKEALKERFKSFNSTLEEVYRNQTAWFVPDLQLREELRISIAEKLLPAYRSFLGRFRSHLECGRHAERYIKYTPEELEDYLSDLFEGSSGSMQQRRRSNS